jgi:hypothetical protein
VKSGSGQRSKSVQEIFPRKHHGQMQRWLEIPVEMTNHGAGRLKMMPFWNELQRENKLFLSLS